MICEGEAPRANASCAAANEQSSEGRTNVQRSQTQTAMPPSDKIADSGPCERRQIEWRFVMIPLNLGPEGFWKEQAQRVDWMTPFTKVKDVDFTFGQVKINCLADGALKRAAQLYRPPPETRGDQTPRSSGNPTSPKERRSISAIAPCTARTCKMANNPARHGRGKGDRVHLMPMIPRGRLCPCWPARALVRSTQSVFCRVLS